MHAPCFDAQVKRRRTLRRWSKQAREKRELALKGAEATPQPVIVEAQRGKPATADRWAIQTDRCACTRVFLNVCA